MVYFPSVLVRPGRSFTLAIDQNRLLQISLALIAIDFILALCALPAMSIAIDAAAAKNPVMIGGMKPVILGFMVLMMSLYRIFFIAAMTLFYQLAVTVLGGANVFRKIFTVLALATVPLVLGRVLRLVAYLTGLTDSIKANPFTFDTLVGAYLPASLAHAARAVDVFDIWTLGLVVSGFVRISGLAPITAALTSFVLWSAVQVLFIRLQSFSGK